MASTVEELSVEYSEGDQVLVKELDKKVLTKGAWATLMFRYQDWDAKKRSMAKKNTPSVVIKNVMVNISRNRNSTSPAQTRPRQLSMHSRVGLKISHYPKTQNI